MNRRPVFFYLGIFLLCMAVLMLQVVQTRILSVVSYYYLAFLSISMAMFGMTAGALVVYFRGERFTSRTLSHDLAWTTAAFACSTTVCFLLQLASAAVTVKSATAIIVWLQLILLLATPFFFAGMAVSLALTRSPFPVNIVYGMDMTGAAVGCLGALILMNRIDAPSAVFAIAAVGALSAACFGASGIGISPGQSPGQFRLLRRPGLLAVGLVALAAANASTSKGFQPIWNKGGSLERRDALDYERWNSFSRIAASVSTPSGPRLWGPSPTLPRNLVVEQRLLNIDGLAGTTMPRFDGDAGSVSFLTYDITNFAYHIRNSGKAAVIGVGSGRDLLAAHLFGFRDITGIELNQIFIDLLTDVPTFRRYAGIADLPGVRFFVDDGRSWFARTAERFDLIQMSMVDTFAATGAGAFSLSENGLYTTEGWRVFLDGLTPTGVFTVSRWHAAAAPVETARVISLAMSALMATGAGNPRDHVFLASSANLSTIVVGRQPLGAADVATLEQAANRLQFQSAITPGRPASEPIFEDLLSARDLDDLNRRARAYLLDVSPPTDARPFFFNQLRIARPLDMLALYRAGTVMGINNNGANLVVTGNLLATGTLALLIVLSAALVIGVILLPARAAVRAVNTRFVGAASSYFMLIGLGFMFVEIGLIQRVSVFLGHPTYGLSVVLFSIILSTGLGSFGSTWLSPVKRSHFVSWALVIGGYLMSLPLWLPDLTYSFQSAGLAIRAAITVAAIFPAGLMMGYGFPAGMRLIDAADAKAATPWLWGINGAAGVLAAGLAVACSIAFSIDATIRVGAGCYLLLVPVWLVLADFTTAGGKPLPRAVAATG